MEWVETAGRSVEEAKEAALDQLGVDESDAEFEVVSEPRAGLFGRVRGEARVRARVRPTSPRPKRGRSRRQAQPARASSRRGRAGDRGSDRESSATSGVTVAERDRPTRDAPVAGNGAVDATATSGGVQTSRRRRSRGGGNRSGPSGPGDSNPASGEGSSSGESPRESQRGEERNRRDRPGQAGATKEEVVGEDLSLEEQGESAREFIDGLVGLLGLEATVTMAVVDTDTAQVSVDGSELGTLIGPGGGTLAALQELARTVVQRRTGGRSERILVDVAGYRAKRAAALQRFTKQVAEEVISSSSERALEPMSASDRKVVHDTINEIDGVVTRSVGEEPRRYIVVAPGTREAEAVEADQG